MRESEGVGGGEGESKRKRKIYKYNKEIVPHSYKRIAS